MRNQFTNFKILLNTLPYDEQINIINQTINRINNNNFNCKKINYASKIDNRYNRLKELKQIENKILLNETN